ncbi:hypothetical protein SAM23877_7645 [Streptomyces ambofaciens ATCC 23877]|uniref:Uncharacterized protein n=1 Tax=Streptomyces ambofaciens (strain ATCC 23877 / 3486 / DSM 40053 / JCM 4204 / NBRC 12836 / NRRL B-2516) TaxID=278992 RepID=A0A0K2B699_STRA7|nr:hypothetical protein SAM23877_0024 [Streptomyces ambofaciens ATCC 23877]AKZ60686.1 hypothetical protein SAM23877_7645 [Streptomyces ambofaciens ATCC 23877]
MTHALGRAHPGAPCAHYHSQVFAFERTA